MRLKNFLIPVVLCLCLLTALAFKPCNQSPVIAAGSTDTVTLSLSDKNASDKILEARFLNMLNRNFVYGEDIMYTDKILNLSTISLLKLADESGEYIEEKALLSFVYDMYGVNVESTAEFNTDYPHKDGYFYIVPQGFTVYSHQAAQITENEDGSYTVITTVLTDAHDSDAQKLKAKTLFVKNPASSFGFNIITSEIFDDALQM